MKYFILIFISGMLMKSATSQVAMMNDSTKDFIVKQFVKTYLPSKHTAIEYLKENITSKDVFGNHDYHGCGIPIIFSSSLKTMLANYNLPDSFLVTQTNSKVYHWDKKKFDFKIVKFYRRQSWFWRHLGFYIPALFYPKYIYVISDPISLDANTIAVKYMIDQRNGQFVKGPILAIFKNDNGNLTLLKELH